MDAQLVTAWTALCQQLSGAFSQPTYINFLLIVTGWVMCRSKPTITNLVCTIGQSLLGHAAKHWTVYERFFYRAAWSLPELCQLLLVKIVAPVIRQCGVERVIYLKIDDTTCGRCGKHVAYAGYFKDASVSNTLKKVVHWSHNWIIGCVAFRAKRWPSWVIGLPVLFVLYRKRPDCNAQHPFQTRQQIAAVMIRQTHRALPDWTIRVGADGQYASQAVAREASAIGSNLVSRIRHDAAIYALPAGRRYRGGGRNPKKGKRLPTPRQLARRRKKGWLKVEALMYGKRQVRLVLPIICLWYHVCKEQPIKLLLVRDPSGVQRDDFIFCTDPTADEVEILERFAARWPIEECINQGKQLGGMEQVQGWCPKTVERQAPFALIVQTLVKSWYLLYGVRARAAAQPQGPKVCGWQPEKSHPSYLDMLATLRRALWSDRIKCKSTILSRVKGLFQLLQFTLCAAA